MTNMDIAKILEKSLTEEIDRSVLLNSLEQLNIKCYGFLGSNGYIYKYDDTGGNIAVIKKIIGLWHPLTLIGIVPGIINYKIRSFSSPLDSSGDVRIIKYGYPMIDFIKLR